MLYYQYTIESASYRMPDSRPLHRHITARLRERCPLCHPDRRLRSAARVVLVIKRVDLLRCINHDHVSVHANNHSNSVNTHRVIPRKIKTLPF